MTTVACIYHANCPDGFASAWAIRHEYPEAQMIPARYGDAIPTFDTKPDVVYVVDFSWPHADLLELAESCGELNVFDHHQTALDHMLGVLGLPPDRRHLVRTEEEIGYNLVLDVGRSGAGITWDFIHDGPRPPLVEYVEDGDLWRFALPGSEQVRALIQAMPKDFEIWDGYMAYTASQLRVQAAPAHMLYRQIVEAVASSGYWVSIGGVDGRQYRSERMVITQCHAILASDVCNEMIERFGSPMAATFFETAEGKCQYSIRTDGSVEAHTFAELFGGGGHPRAAGFTTSGPVHVRRSGRGDIAPGRVSWGESQASPSPDVTAD